jgi:hypothetical protein
MLTTTSGAPLALPTLNIQDITLRCYNNVPPGVNGIPIGTLLFAEAEEGVTAVTDKGVPGTATAAPPPVADRAGVSAALLLLVKCGAITGDATDT